jgi:hypothetical protein
MGYTKYLSVIVSEKLDQGEVEELPAVEPRTRVLLSVVLYQMRPSFLLVCDEIFQPVLRQPDKGSSEKSLADRGKLHPCQGAGSPTLFVFE